MHLSISAGLLLAAVALLASAPKPAIAYDFSWAPTKDKVAPVNTAWTAAFLGGTGASGARVSLDDVVEAAAEARSRFRRRASAGFSGNDVSDAGWFTDWKYCDSSESYEAWGLSYDDGPSGYTPGVLNYLKQKDVYATFFAIGSRVMDHPDVLLSTYQSGHQIGIHTWSHPHLTNLTNDQIVAEIVYGAMAIKEVTGIIPKYMRPPCESLILSPMTSIVRVLTLSLRYRADGDINDRVRGVLKAMGLRVIVWATDSTDSLDGATAASIARVVSQWGGSNYDRAISLEHDLLDVEAAAITPTLDALLSFGRSPRPIADCIGYGMSDSYAASPLQQFFNDGYFDGNVHTPPPTASASSSISSASTATIGANKGGNSSSTSVVSTTSSASTAPSSTHSSSTSGSVWPRASASPAQLVVSAAAISFLLLVAL
ncbi:chitin deacetylase [Cladochytrium tenue]|nr:chitin deacetylase [Cladochytrium tenue]